jgi:Papain family cysteine protease
MDAAYAYIKDNNGIDLESVYPYEAKDNICRYNASLSGASVTGYVGEVILSIFLSYFSFETCNLA